ncbi:MAG: SusC/RagA family TonB-linked outer membrane protein [Paludibacteraceae bacterium]|nr:SusC/RagA family TonB-linked outer membrane protein [Paludibacteraceae bacterium]
MKKSYSILLCLFMVSTAMWADEAAVDSISEIVSLGYWETAKSDVNASIVTISAETLTDATTCDLGDMLQGKMAGVRVVRSSGQPGSSAEISVRGINSNSGAAMPVYVVDGIVGGTFNPNDIETVSVLKDAGSAALYGGAVGGVFVITTKSGAYGSKPRVTIRSRVGTAMPQFGNFVPMKSEELYNYHKSLYSESEFNDKYPALSELADYNWRNEVYRNSLIQNHYVSVAGGGKRVGYYCSLDYYGEDGTMQSTGMQKFAGHAALKIDVCKWLDMHIKTDFVSSKTNRPYSGRMISDAFYKLPWDCPYAYDADGNVTNQYVRIGSGTRPDNGGKWWSSQTNSLHSAQYNYDRLEEFSFAASLQLNFHITDWLHFTSTNSYDFGSSLFSSYIDPRTYDTNFKDGYLGKQPGEGSNFITTNILRAAYTWGDHSVSGLIGGEYGLWKSEYFTADGIRMLDGMDALNVVTPLSVGGFATKGLSYGVFAQVGYDYAKRYFINAAYRCGASSLYAPGSLQGHFPSVSAAWLISNEAFMQEQNIVSFLKLRANYIFTSNNRASDDLPDYTSSHFTDPGMAVVIPPSIFSGREHSNTYTVGIDLAFINRIDMSIDLYQTDYNELENVYVYIVPYYGGHYSKIEYKMRRRGIDYRLDAQVLNMNDLRWNVGFNIAFNQLMLTELPDYGFSFSYTTSSLKVGEDPYTWYMKEWAGVNPANGDPLWYRVDADGNYILNAAGNKTVTSNYNAALPHAVGKVTPLFFGGLNTQLSWKGLALSINTNFTYGNKVYNYVRYSMDADGAYLGYNQLSMDNNRLGWSRWTQPGDIATHPKAVLGGNQDASQFSSRYLEDGSFFRLKNITLSYDFCATLIPQKYMSKCRIFVSADNVATATRFSGVNPDVSSGEYRETYPLARNIVGGIEIAF